MSKSEKWIFGIVLGGCLYIPFVAFGVFGTIGLFLFFFLIGSLGKIKIKP